MRRLLAGSALVATALVATAGPLTPGSDAANCLNMIEPGAMAQCEPRRAEQASEPLLSVGVPARPSEASTTVPSPAHAANPTRSPPRTAVVIGGVSEAEVDEFLANHGKPPREAVRALLNPTEENVRALDARHKRDEVIRTIVAQRLTELQREGFAQPAALARDFHAVLPQFVGMQITLYVTPACAPCDAAIAVLKQFVQDFPVVIGRVALIAETEASVLTALLHWNVALPATTLTRVQASERKLDRVPAFEITDTRQRRAITLVGAHGVDALRQAVLALRKNADD